MDEDAGSQDNQDDDGMSNPQHCNDGQSSISPEKAALFQRRFEEGYDLPDDEYVKWLHETHSESIMNQTASAIENDTLGTSQLLQKMYVVFVFKCTRGMKRILIGFSTSAVGGYLKIALMKMILYMMCIVGNYAVPINCVVD